MPNPHSRGRRSRNKQRRVIPAAVSTAPGQIVAQTTAVPAGVSPKPVTPARPAGQPKAPAYPYLMNDLKRVGILTVLAIVVLVVLYFVNVDSLLR